MVRGIEYSSNNRSIDMRVSSLRKKLIQAETFNAVIKTVRNKGYKLVGDQIRRLKPNLYPCSNVYIWKAS